MPVWQTVTVYQSVEPTLHIFKICYSQWICSFCCLYWDSLSWDRNASLCVPLTKWRSKGGFTHTMPFPCNAVPLRVYTVSVSFHLHSAAVFDSHMPYRFNAVPLPCHEYAVLKATSQGHGRGTVWYLRVSIGRPETTYGRTARVRHCLRMAWSWQGRGMETARYLWISL
jgi:hypothetical protein